LGEFYAIDRKAATKEGGDGKNALAKKCARQAATTQRRTPGSPFLKF
jgi:hypothetical protein